MKVEKGMNEERILTFSREQKATLVSLGRNFSLFYGGKECTDNRSVDRPRSVFKDAIVIFKGIYDSEKNEEKH